jgi:hypothetical protein
MQVQLDSGSITCTRRMRNNQGNMGEYEPGGTWICPRESYRVAGKDFR